MHRKILVVDSDPEVRQLLNGSLLLAGFQVSSVSDGSLAVARARMERPALIVLDLDLPKLSGLEVCRQLKNDATLDEIPIIILTARAKEEDRILGFELGADDYVTKPFNVRELGLRIQLSLRRAYGKSPLEETQVLGDLVLDPVRHEVTVRSQSVFLTAIEFRLLSLLMKRNGYVLDRETLLNDVWGQSSTTITRTVDTHMTRLRRKLGPLGHWLETTRGVGYRLKEERASILSEVERAPARRTEPRYRSQWLENDRAQVPTRKKVALAH